MNKELFKTKDLPMFANIPWEDAEVGKCIELTKSEYLLNEKNINFIKSDAKSHGITLDIFYTVNGIDCFIKEIRRKPSTISQADIPVVMRLLGELDDGDYMTAQDIYRNGGSNFNQGKYRATLRHLVNTNVIKCAPHQHPNGGRPTTKYWIERQD